MPSPLIAGMDEYVPKPLPYEQLAALCRRFIAPAADPAAAA
jgi:hypothetical protein